MVDTTTALDPNTASDTAMVTGSITGAASADTPPAQTQTPAVDANDPVAVAKAAYDKAVADAAAKAGTPVVDPAKPVVPANGQPAVDNVPSDKNDAGIVTYEPTGDAGIDMALSFIGSLGIEGNDPSMVAAANGDFSFIKAKLATMGDAAKGWEMQVALAEQGYARQADAWKAEQGKTLDAVHKVAGGADQWNALVEWAGTQVDAAEKAALDAMFDAGPTSAAMAARMLKQAYAEAKGTTITPANPATAASGVAPAAPTALTQANYHKEVSALYDQIGSRMDTSPEYAAIRQRYFGR